AAGARLSVLDRFLAKTVLIHLFTLTAGALLPPLLALYGLAEERVWQVAAVLFALPMLAVIVTYPHRRRQVVGKGPPPLVYAIFVVLSGVVTGAMLIYVAAGFPNGAA